MVAPQRAPEDVGRAIEGAVGWWCCPPRAAPCFWLGGGGDGHLGLARWLLVRAGVLELMWPLSAVAPRRASVVRTRLLGWVDREGFRASEDVVVDVWAGFRRQSHM